MNEKIIQFSKGIFDEAGTGLILSDNSLVLQVEEGNSVRGSFYIGNDRDVHMQGILYSDCPYITLNSNNVNPRELTIEYEFRTEGLMAGESVDGIIYAITNCGEVNIPVSVTVDAPSVSYDGGRVKDLTGFATLARDMPKEALNIFVSEDFEEVFLYRDIENRILYRALMKGSDPVHAMEEFLVAVRKKNRLLISVDRNNIEYADVNRVITDKITVSKNTWGSVGIEIRSDVDFIVPGNRTLRTDSFDGDNTPLLFTIDPSRMTEGRNVGRIYLDTNHQHIEITISCNAFRRCYRDDILQGRYTLKVMREFVELRSSMITPAEFRKRITALTTEYRGHCEEFSDLSEAYAAIISSADNMGEYIEAIRARTEPSSGDDAKTYTTYCLYLYVLAMYHTVIGDREETLRLVRIMSDIYKNEYDHWFVFYLLMIMEPEYKNSHNAFMKIKEYIAGGCTSPLMYGAFCELLRDDSSLIHEWNDSMLRPLIWGAERGMLSEEMAGGFAYHVSRLRNYSNIIFKSLGKLYEQYESKEILQVICRMLINVGRTDEEALYWYDMGIRRQVRITQLYEYYIRSLPIDDDRIIPHTVLMYFALDNRLPDKEKSRLFASVIRGKKEDNVAYKAYSVMMSNYAREQLVQGCINSDLAIIYEDCIRLDSIDELMAHSLPKIMFRKEIICSRRNIEAVCVIHKELEKEQVVNLTDGHAYIDIYSSDAYIFLIDDKGNRYYNSEDYTLRKLLHMDSYAERCFNTTSVEDSLLAYMYIKCNKDYRTGEDVINVRRMAHKRLGLNIYYRKNNLSALISYYYEHADGERLDELLENLNLEDCSRDNIYKWIELYIVRGMYLNALHAISIYGYSDIDSSRLGRMCEELIAMPLESIIWEGKSLTETLTETAYEVFARGGYTRPILAYLASTYKGASKSMLEIWRAAAGLEVETGDFEERILDRLLLVEDRITEGIPVLEKYLEKGSDDTYKKAYISYIMYVYITSENVSNIHINDTIWRYIREKIMFDYNNTCLLARLKSYSFKDSLDENEELFCEVNLTKLYKSGIIMKFYKNFEGKLKAYIGTSDREILECMARPGIAMKLRCTMADGSVSIMKAPEVHYGIYVKDIIVFTGEKVRYEFFEEKGGRNIVYASGEVQYSRGPGDGSGRLGMLNDMIDTFGKRDYDRLYDKMSEYILTDEVAKDLFTIL